MENKENTFASLCFLLWKNIRKTKTHFSENYFQRTPIWCSLFFKKLLSRTIFKNKNQMNP